MKIMILYYSKTGHTLEAVKAIADGINDVGSDADLVTVKEFNSGSIVDYDGLIVGSPCWAGSTGILRGVPKVLSKLIESLDIDCLKGKRCGGISVHAKMGGTNTVRTLGKLLSLKGCDDYRPGPVARAGVPLSLWKGSSLSDKAKNIFKTFGAGFVNLN